MAGSAIYCPGGNKLFSSSRSSLDKLRLPDKLLDGSPRRSILDTLDFSRVVDGAGEEDRELGLDSSMTIVDAGLDNLAEVVARLREVDRDPDSAARVASPEEPDESLKSDDEENQFSEFARLSISSCDVFVQNTGAP